MAIDPERPVSLLKHLESLPDPRSKRNRKHLLVDVVAIAVCSVLVGCNGPTAIRLWAEQREEWLRGFLTLPEGLPSKDCLWRVLSRLKPDALARCFTAWCRVAEHTDEGGRLIAVDGKTLRRSHDKKKHLRALHVVSALASETGLSLRQLATDEKSNEITAIPELLDAIDLDDAVVTLDAMGCQKEISKKIVGEKGNYVLELKGNHEKLHAAVREHFDELHEKTSRTPTAFAARPTTPVTAGSNNATNIGPAARITGAAGHRLVGARDDRSGDLNHRTRRPRGQRRALLPQQPEAGGEAFR